MSRRAVRTFLVVYLGSVVLGMVFRVDAFPYTWVNMYAGFTPSDTIVVNERNPDDLKKGLEVTQRDGAQHWLTARELNIPNRSAKRIFFDRPFNAKRIQTGRQRPARDPYWLRRLRGGTGEQEDDWDWKLFHSLNRTLGLRPEDDAFIVAITTSKTKTFYRRSDLEQIRRHRRTITIEWKDSWSDRW